MGVPGEAQALILQNKFKGDDPRNRVSPGGAAGLYRVQLLLSRPGFPISRERAYQFIDNIVGTSHVQILKPIREQTPADPTEILLQYQYTDKNLVQHFGVFQGLADENGFLGKLITDDLDADSFNDAELKAYGGIAPFLSAWSLHLDVPVYVEAIQCTYKPTGSAMLRIYAPHLEMRFGGGPLPFLPDDFCHYASLYREALNTNSEFYRFLCLFKILEGMEKRRARVAAEAKEKGTPISKPTIRERVPEDINGRVTLLRQIYPWQNQWDEMSLSQIFSYRKLWQKYSRDSCYSLKWDQRRHCACTLGRRRSKNFHR